MNKYWRLISPGEWGKESRLVQSSILGFKLLSDYNAFYLTKQQLDEITRLFLTYSKISPVKFKFYYLDNKEQRLLVDFTNGRKKSTSQFNSFGKLNHSSEIIMYSNKKAKTSVYLNFFTGNDDYFYISKTIRPDYYLPDEAEITYYKCDGFFALIKFITWCYGDYLITLQ